MANLKETVVACAILVTFSMVPNANATSSSGKVCFVVVSGGTNGNWEEKYFHEIAHCNGWKHPYGQHGLTPPKSFVHNPKIHVSVTMATLTEARKLCDGAMACQWFDR